MPPTEALEDLRRQLLTADKLAEDTGRAVAR